MINVLFICVHNAARSQMAEAFFNRLAPPGMRACSAGTEPGSAVNPLAALAMTEAGIDLAGQRPKLADERMAAETTFAVTMGCGVDAACPLLVGVKVDEDWELPDPAGRDLPFMRAVRDRILEKVADLIRRLREPVAATPPRIPR